MRQTLPNKYDAFWMSEKIGCKKIAWGDRDANGTRRDRMLLPITGRCVSLMATITNKSAF